jgi:hypothetical protein
MVNIDQIVNEAIPLPRSCAYQIQKAEWKRKKLKDAILQLLKENTNFTQTYSNGIDRSAEADSESPAS